MNFSAEMGGWMQWRAEDVRGEQGSSFQAKFQCPCLA
jgi:hypothetical protein